LWTLVALELHPDISNTLPLTKKIEEKEKSTLK